MAWELGKKTIAGIVWTGEKGEDGKEVVEINVSSCYCDPAGPTAHRQPREASVTLAYDEAKTLAQLKADAIAALKAKAVPA